MDKIVSLPNPKAQFLKHGNNLLYSLENRASTREYSQEIPSLADISAILWSAYGITRETSDRRTVPLILGTANIVLYVINKDGVWHCVSEHHHLLRKTSKDIRADQAHRSKQTPVTLAYAVNKKLNRVPGTEMFHAGCMAQNVGLYCANAGLGNIILNTDNFDMKLPDNEKLLVLQGIGVKK